MVHSAGEMDSIQGKNVSKPECKDILLSSGSSTGSSCEIMDKLGAAKIRPSSQPPNTSVYIVTGADKLTSIAAHFDTTPSCLRKLNKLSSDFLYAGQCIYVPEKAGSHMTSSVQTSIEGDTLSSSSSAVEDSLSNSGKLSPELSMHSSISDTERTKAFIKLHSKYITTDQGVVDGTLIVTPNAVMFDPNVSDPLVVENGIDEYGVVAKMDTIVAAAIYRDIEAISKLQDSNCNTITEKPEPYTGLCGDLLKDAAEKLNGLTLTDSRLVSPTALISEVNGKLPSEEPNHKPDISEQKEDNSGSKIIQAFEEKKRNNSSESSIKSCMKQRFTQRFPCSLERQSSQVRFELENDEAFVTQNNIQNNRKAKFSMQFSIDDLDGSDEDNVDDDSLLEASDNEDDNEKKYSDLVPQQSPSPAMAYRRFVFSQSRDSPSSASTYSVQMDENVQVFVDYTSGLFAQGSVPNFSAFCHGRPDSFPKTSETQKINRQENHYVPDLSQTVKDKHLHIFRASDQLIPEALFRHKHHSDEEGQPYFLCLQVAKPINRPVLSECPYDSYSKQRLRPIYWFTIPSTKADSLYSFFTHWQPERYGENIQDELTLSSKGFLPIKDEEVLDVPSSGSSLTRLYKDWEILSLDEFSRRKSLLNLDKYSLLPELSVSSCILSEDHLLKLVSELPCRLQGQEWFLVFSHIQHGYSLGTMLRKMESLDSPVLLVIEDTNGLVFGAFSTSAFHISNHFLGTGESFLFTFLEDFKIYHWTRKNSFFTKGGLDGLTIGCGGNVGGLWIDEDLYRGRTQSCDTFHNEPLTGDREDFVIKSIEVWSFSEACITNSKHELILSVN